MAKILLPVMILLIGGLISFWMMQTSPKAKIRPKTRSSTLVEVIPVTYGPQATRINVMGLVKPSRMVELKPQVSGEIIGVSTKFLPGGKLRRGEKIVTIDPTDYQLALRQKASDVARAKADLQMEQGYQLVARKEFELLGEEVSPEEEALMLRQPQLDSSQASYEAALAAYERAQTDLARTKIVAPFNAVIQSRQVNRGTRVAPTTTLATLVGTDNYWVEISVPVSQLKWITIPQEAGSTGASVKLYDTTAWGKEGHRTGEIVGITAAIEENGRMARLLVNLPDPLALKPENSGKPAVLLDSYLQVVVDGKLLENVAAINRKYLRDNESVWIMENDRLEMRPVEIAFRDRDQVYISEGVKPGEQMIVSNLPAPVEGMLLRLEGEQAPVETAAGNDADRKGSANAK